MNMNVDNRPRMTFLDRFLPVWIILAMAAGLLIGRVVPGISDALGALEVGGISLPIALGLLVMMYPPLAKVRYDKAVEIAADKRLMTVSIVLNWLVGPAFMFALAWIFLPDQPELRTGLIIVGLARCIAMVLVWSDLSCGDREATAVLVAINSVFQVIMLGVLGWFYLQVLPAWLGLETTSAEFSFWSIVASVLVFLGIPLATGVASRIIGEKPRAVPGTKTPTCRRSPRWHWSACSIPSCCCFPCRASRLPPSRGPWPAWLCRCWPTSSACSPSD